MRQPAKRLRRRTSAWAAAFALAAAIPAAAPPGALALPANFWGIVPQAAPTAEQLQRLKLGGVDSIRLSISWSGVQPTQGGPFDWSVPDAQIGSAAAAGIDVLAVVAGAPTWVVPLRWVPGSHRSVQASKNLPVRGGKGRAWAGFLRTVVARYGPSGSFWAENPALPRRPIHVWQIWNEENFKYFVVRPNPAEYAKLVQISHRAIEAVDPGAKIVLGGLFAWPKEASYRRRPRQAYYATDFLDRMYRGAAGIGSSFDGVALHPYARSYRYLGRQVGEVREVLKAHRDAGKGLWITEMGWSSGHPAPANGFNHFEKGRRGQARQLQGAFRLLRRNQRKWHLRRVYWFSVNDAPGACNFCDGSGLFGPGFVPKPAWYAYARFAGGTP